MGNYSQLYVDRLYFSWKNTIPNFLAFLFSPDDFYEEEETGSEDEGSDGLMRFGYKTTSMNSLAVMDKFGYSLDFCAQVYAFYYDNLLSDLETTIEYEIRDQLPVFTDAEVIDERFQEYLESYPKISRIEELQDFVRFLRQFRCTDFKIPPFDEPYENHFARKYPKLHVPQYKTPREFFFDRDSVNQTVYLDFEKLGDYVKNRYMRFPPWHAMLCDLFGLYYYIDDDPDVVSIAMLRLVLESTEPNSIVNLDLSDVIFDRDEAKGLHSELAASFVEKLRLHNKVFDPLLRYQEDIRLRYTKAECADLLEKSTSTTNTFEKGRMFEYLTELLFTSIDELTTIGKNVSTSDEEIDIILKNNISRPFWMAFHSPLFFVECKNWHGPVGASELRNFEIKLRNHGNLVKVGFLVSVNGFTSEVIGELKRGGRDTYHVIILSRQDIEEYISSPLDFFNWLESKAARLY